MSTETRILVVDDNHDARRYVQRVLESADYTVIHASDGEVALDRLSQERVDLIIADVAMPHMNGYQLFEKVMQHPEWVSVPFVFLSARALDSDIRYAKLMGADEYLTKPVRAQDLLTAVRGRLNRAKLMSRSISQSVADSHPDGDKLVYGNLCVDPNTYRVMVEDQQINLSVREFRLLKCLIEHNGNVVDLSTLAMASHEIATSSRDAGNLVRHLVRSIRRKFGYGPGEWGCIWNVRGIGYKIVGTDI